MKDKFIEINKKAALAGSSLIVSSKDEILEELNYGYSDLDLNKKVTSNTVFRIASISKMIVALGIMKLYEEGLLDIDKDISEYLNFNLRNPKYPDKVITIKMLMTQTSSITDGKEYTTGYNLINGTNKDVNLEDLLLQDGKYFVDETFDDNIPGSKFIYSNFNCGILACVIENVSNKIFTDYIKEVLLTPLNIDGSFRVSDIKNDDIATLYYYKDGKHIVSRTKEDFLKNEYKIFPLGQNFRGPAGGLFISMKDLSKIMRVFMKESKLFKKSTIDLMLETHWQGIGDGEYRAKGLQIMILDYFDNKRLFGHFGDAYGAKSFMLFNPVKNIGICYITNGGGFKYQDFGICDIHEDLINLFLDKYWSSNA